MMELFDENNYLFFYRMNIDTQTNTQTHTHTDTHTHTQTHTHITLSPYSRRQDWLFKVECDYLYGERIFFLYNMG